MFLCVNNYVDLMFTAACNRIWIYGSLINVHPFLLRNIIHPLTYVMYRRHCTVASLVKIGKMMS